MKRLVLLLLFFPAALLAQPVAVTVNADQGKTTISRHIYGHFAEHLGRCIYGGFYVGEDNPEIPNIQGVRTDVVEALRELNIPNLRWPGGCFADTYHWKDGIGPKDQRPELVNRWWGGVTEDNSFGTHDFLNLCELLETEPYLAANVGSGTVQELADWLQYVNHEGKSPMADLRRQNGREAPWKVKYWGVGNEAWGCGGHMTAEYYANIYRQYATFMSDWGNSDGLYRVAAGASGSDYHWTEVMMRDIPRNLIEGVSLHFYSVIDWNNKGSATEFTEEQYFATMRQALSMDEKVRRHINIMDRYDPEGRIGLIVDEWGGWYDVEPGTNPGFLYQQNTMRDAMIAGATLNIFNNHAERVHMANLAQTVNVLQAVVLTDEERMIRTPTYHVMHMYRGHQDATLLPVQFEPVHYELGDQALPALSISASRDSTGTVRVSLTNIDARQTHDLELNLRGIDLSEVSGRILRSDALQDHNTFEDPDRIAPQALEGLSLSEGTVALSLPPFSVVVLELQ